MKLFEKTRTFSCGTDYNNVKTMPLIKMGRYTLQQRIKIFKFTTKMHENEPEFHRKIIMSDDAHIYLGGYVNKQNCRIWG